VLYDGMAAEFVGEPISLLSYRWAAWVAKDCLARRFASNDGFMVGSGIRMLRGIRSNAKTMPKHSAPSQDLCPPTVRWTFGAYGNASYL
jgi:hypothetical protein